MRKNIFSAFVRLYFSLVNPYHHFHVFPFGFGNKLEETSFSDFTRLTLILNTEFSNWFIYETSAHILSKIIPKTVFCGINVVAVVVFFLFLRNYLLMLSEISKGYFWYFQALLPPSFECLWIHASVQHAWSRHWANYVHKGWTWIWNSH